MLKFHPHSILTGDTMVGFVIFCVLSKMFENWLHVKFQHTNWRVQEELMENLRLSLYDLELTDLVFIQKLISRKYLALIKNNGQTLPDIFSLFYLEVHLVGGVILGVGWLVFIREWWVRILWRICGHRRFTGKNK